jgi:hypothetical protein
MLDNRGVGGSTGTVADNVTDLAPDAVAFTDLATREAQAAAIRTRRS